MDLTWRGKTGSDIASGEIVRRDRRILLTDCL